MTQHPFYLGYGIALLLLLGMSEYRGMTFLGYDEVKNIPKTVRDNPGAYRSHYRASPRYFGGK